MDVNEAATERWIENTDGFDRVRSVLRQTHKPTAVSEIADWAHVSETTARKHLDRLVDLGAATTTQKDRTTLYERNEEYHIVQRVQELQREHTRQELMKGIQAMKATIREYRENYGVDSLEDLALDLDAEEAEPWDAISEWEGTRRNLALAQTALSYKRTRDLIEA